MIVRPVIEEYAREHTTPPSPMLAAVAASTAEELDHPEMMVGAIEGGLLATLVALLRPRSILEIGTFSGYSALAMAEAMRTGCRIVTLEADPHHAAAARRHFDDSGFGDRIELVEGPAGETLKTLTGPFELVFIDADKPSYVGYLDAVLPMLSPDGLIVADNALHFAISPDPADAAGIRAFNDHVAAHPDLTQVLLTVRAGIMLIRRTASD